MKDKELRSAWQAPSNIALVKYWGKKSGGIQLPANASLSFTLDTCRTSTILSLEDRSNKNPYEAIVYLKGEEQSSFLPKIYDFFGRISSEFGWLVAYRLIINTENSFPHSSGIASSASSMSALALCILEMDAQLRGEDFVLSDQNRDKASRMARLGSGSACRSLFPEIGVWGEHAHYKGSNDQSAVAFIDLHPVFKTFRDTILVVEQGKKAVSSSEGHGLVNGHPFAPARYKEAAKNMEHMASILRTGDLNAFQEVVEQEAFMLHALMMSSSPWFILMKPNTLSLIERIVEVRKQSGLMMVITLDAGANIHLLYPESDADAVEAFVAKDLAPFCENRMYICDRVGQGPQKQ